MYIPGMSPESKARKVSTARAASASGDAQSAMKEGPGIVVVQKRALLHADKVLQTDLKLHLAQSLERFASIVGKEAFHVHMKSVDFQIVRELGLAPLFSAVT